MHDVSDDRRARFLALPDLELDILAVLSAAGEPLVQSKLVAMAVGAGLRTPDDRRQVNSGLIKPLLKRWDELGFTHCDVQHQYSHSCADDVAHWALDRASESRLLKHVVRGVQHIMPAQQHYYMSNPQHLYRDARLMLYLGEPEAASAALRDASERAARMHQTEVQPSLAALFGPNAPAEALARLPLAVAERYVADVLDLGLKWLVPLGDGAWGLCCWTAEHSEHLAHQAMVLALLRADAAACRELATGHGALEVEISGALAALIEGDISAAREQAASALIISRGPKKTRKPRIEGPAEPYLALLLLTGVNPEHRSLAQSMISTRRRRGPLTSTACQVLTVLDAFLQNPAEKKSLEGDWWVFGTSRQDWCKNLFWGLFGCYTGQRDAVGLQFGTRSEQVLSCARESGYSWLFEEFEELTRVFEGGDPPVGGLLRLYTARSEWEHALDALAAVAQQAAPKGAESAGSKQRVLWQLTYHSGESGEDDDRFEGEDEPVWMRHLERYGQRGPGIELEPKLQRRRGKGWTAGSRVTLSKLQKACSEGKLPSEDVRVCAHIVEGPYSSRSLELAESVGLALVAHPRVVWQEGGAPAEVVRAEPSLVVKERDTDIVLSMYPHPENEGERVVYARDGSRLRVYSLERVHQQLGRVLGAGISLPSSGREQLQQTLGELAGLVPLQSEVELRGGEAEGVAADPRPVLQLRRATQGLLIRSCVFPLGLHGPDLQPGRGAATVVARVEGQALRTERDLAGESERFAEVMARCPSYPQVEGEKGEVALVDILSCYELLAELAKLDENDVVIAWPEGQPLSVVAEREVRDLKLRLSSSGDWLSAVGSLAVDGELVLDLSALLARLAEGQGRFIELGEGKVLALSERLRRRIEALGALGRRKGDALELPPMALFSLEGWVGTHGNVKVDRKVKKQLTRVREAQALEPILPSTLQADLRDYQREGFTWLCRLAHWGGGACLADDMGLGKTLQALALLLYRAERDDALLPHAAGGALRRGRPRSDPCRPRRL
ncbi:MAG: hypothetical protein JRH20_11280 [Deltaproteobacteria bacterium]|nr:hypothetical protein [Deltaproteobacteria bacterium]